jgi:hypothetical protein
MLFKSGLVESESFFRLAVDIFWELITGIFAPVNNNGARRTSPRAPLPKLVNL